MQARGIDFVGGFYEETVYGVEPGAPAAMKVYLKSFGLEPSQNLIDSETLDPNRSRVKPSAGNLNPSGDLVAELAAEWMGKIFKHAIGPVTTTGAGPYSHLFKIGALPAGFTFERDHGSQIAGVGRFERYNGNRFSKWDINIPVEGYAIFTGSGIGRDSAPYAAALDASYDDLGHTPFTAFDVTVVDEGGSAIASVQKAKFSGDNDLDDSLYVLGGAGRRRALPEGFATVTYEITALFESYDLIQKARDRTQTAFKVKFSRGDGLGTAGNESIEIHVTKGLLELKGTPVDGPKGILATLPGKAFRLGADNGLEVTVKNAVAVV